MSFPFHTIPAQDTLRVAVLGPAHIPGLCQFLHDKDSLAVTGIKGMGGYNINALVIGRVQRQMFTHLITLDTTVQQVHCFKGPHLILTVCPRRPRRALRSAYRAERLCLAQAIRSVAADIIHANWTYEYALAALPFRDKLLISVHDHSRRILSLSGARYLPLYLITRYVFSRGRHFAVPSPYIASYVKRHTHKAPVIIPNNISDAIYERGAILGPPKFRGEPVIVSAISASPFKGAKIALEAFAIFRRKFPKARYLVAGPGLGKDSAIARWCARKQFGHGVQFMGQLPHESCLRLIEQAHAVLHPSREESFGNVLIEAMALRRLVVAGVRAGACPWVLGNGRAGVLVDVKNPHKVADALCNVFSCWESNAGKLKEATKLVKTRYSSESVTGQYLDVYKSIINDRRLP